VSNLRAQLSENHACIVRTVCLLKSRLCMRVAQGDDTTLLPIDLSQVRRHIKFNAEENEAVRDRVTVFTMAVLRSCHFSYHSLSKKNCTDVLSAESVCLSIVMFLKTL